MRELIYLSERKLNQFQQDGARRGWWRRVRGLGGKAPLGLGEVSLTLADGPAASTPDLDRVLDAIDSSARASQWYENDAVQAGEWVHFEARLNYRIVTASRSKPRYPALVFWDHAQTSAEDDLGEVRLLLHGDPRHLVGDVSLAQAPPAPMELAMSRPATFVEFMGSLEGKSFSQTLWFFLRDLQESLPLETASWVAGYARVTANVEMAGTPFGSRRTRVVVASPLYVEHVTAPEPT